MSRSLMASVDEAVRSIERLDSSTEIPRLVEHNEEIGATFIAANPEHAEALAFLQFTSIISIPNLARRMAAFIEARSGTLAECCALAAVLWYIGNPNDVLPDNCRGSIGFLDDAAILNLLAAELLLPILKPAGLSKQILQNEYNVVCQGIPHSLIEPLKDQVRFVSGLVQCCLEESSFATEDMLQKMLRDTRTIDRMAHHYLNRPQSSTADAPAPPSGDPEYPRVTVSKGGDSVYRDTSGYTSVSFGTGGGIAMSPGGNILSWD